MPDVGKAEARAEGEAFIAKLLSELTARSISACLLNWAGDLWNGTGDVDILVDRQSMDAAARLTTDLARASGGACVYQARRAHHFHQIHVLPSLDGGPPTTLPVDFQSAMVESGVELGPATDILDGADWECGYPRLAPPMNAALIVARAVLGNRFLATPYWEFVRTTFAAEPRATQSILCQFLGSSASRRISSCITMDDENGVLALRSEVLSQGFGTRSLGAMSNWLRRFGRRTRWLAQPPGLFISIEGPHVATCSETARALADILQGTPRPVLYLERPTVRRSSRTHLTSPILAAFSCLVRYFQTIRPILSKNGIVITDGLYAPLDQALHESESRVFAAAARKLAVTPSFTVVFGDSQDQDQVAQDIDDPFSTDRPNSSPCQGFMTIEDPSEYENVPFSILNEVFLSQSPLGVQSHQAVGSRFRPARQGSESMGPPRCLAKYRLAHGRFTLSFIGLDGAGKGTYIDLLCHHLREHDLSYRRCYLGYSSYRLPALKKIDARRAHGHARRAASPLTLTYLALLPLDFLARRGTGTYDIVITDRHPKYEPVFGNGLLRWYDLLIARLCPVPDLVIYLTGDTESLWGRKRETDLASYRARKARLDELVAHQESTWQTVSIDTVGNVSDVLEDIKAAITASRRAARPANG